MHDDWLVELKLLYISYAAYQSESEMVCMMIVHPH